MLLHVECMDWVRRPYLRVRGSDGVPLLFIIRRVGWSCDATRRPLRAIGSVGSHIIALMLEMVSNEYGQERANKLIVDLQLEELGWQVVE